MTWARAMPINFGLLPRHWAFIDRFLTNPCQRPPDSVATRMYTRMPDCFFLPRFAIGTMAWASTCPGALLVLQPPMMLSLDILRTKARDCFMHKSCGHHTVH